MNLLQTEFNISTKSRNLSGKTAEGIVVEVVVVVVVEVVFEVALVVEVEITVALTIAVTEIVVAMLIFWLIIIDFLSNEDLLTEIQQHFIWTECLLLYSFIS